MKKGLLLFLACLSFILTSAQVNLTYGLVGCYPFSGDANDYSGGNHNGVVSGATLATDRFGNANSAYHFNGTSDFISVPNYGTMIAQDEVTISVWGKADSYTSNIAILLVPDASNDRMACGMNYVGGPFAIWDYGNFTSGGRQIANTGTYSSNWEHYVFVTSQSGNIKSIYRNGTLLTTSAYGNSLSNRNRSLYFGSSDDYSSGNVRWHGFLDDIRVYNRALSAVEIDSLYTLTSAGACMGTTNLNTGLVGCYPFCGDANDYSGGNHNGSVSGATLATDRFGNSNCAYHFNGTSDFISVPNFNTMVPQDEITVSVWGMADSYTSNIAVLLVPDASSDRLACGMDYTGGFDAIWDYGNFISGGRVIVSNGSYNTTWQHYVFITSKSANTKFIYRNGVLISSTPYGSSLTNRNRSLYFGSSTDWSGGGIRWHGYLDDIRIYDRALSSSEVSSLYNFTAADNCGFVTAVENSKKTTFHVSPVDGFAGEYRISSGDEAVRGNIVIYNMMGQMVYSKEMNMPAYGEELIQLNNVAKGIYFLNVVTADQRYSLKFER